MLLWSIIYKYKYKLTLSNLALMTVTAHHLAEAFCIFIKLGEYGKITAKTMLASLVAM